ncbi:MAG: hypothetical protein V3W41_13210 [Planctomycetota bacterium]
MAIACREKITYKMGALPKMIRREGAMALSNPNWICIEGSSADRIVEGCYSFSKVGAQRDPQEIECALARLDNGLFGLFFSPQLTPVVFANFVTWIGDRGIVEEVSGACGWTRAGREGMRFLFSMDGQNKSEDTMLALSNQKDRVEVYLPDGSCCPTSRVVKSILEPELKDGTVELLCNFRITLDGDREEGNAAFLLTHGLDQVWNDTYC